ncbi:MAG: class I SAM-dependent methyltransferase [Actinobacteria bacterium]|nr:MAG: class I SAM-dependent methyltransferase [Actinomycetota bacterium]
MLSVDYDRLGLRAGERLLDLGCGGGRHAYEALRRGARVTALDASEGELGDVSTVMSAMEKQDADTGTLSEGNGAAVCADALAIPFRDASFDRVIAAEVLEHLPRDQVAMAELARVLRPGGSMAVTVPRFGPEVVNWALSNAYHSVEGGHVRIYRRSSLLGRLSRVGLRLRGSHHAHALHSPYWWLRCAVGVERDEHPLVRAYHRLLVWDIVRTPLLTRALDRALNPLLGKSLVVYLDRCA